MSWAIIKEALVILFFIFSATILLIAAYITEHYWRYYIAGAVLMALFAWWDSSCEREES